MRLILVQHGEALTKDQDPGRPLSPGGGRDVQRMAGFLEKAGIRLDRIVHSGKKRARQTAEVMGEKLLIKGEVEAIEGINPNDPVEEFSANIPKYKTDTMVVGHLPFVARLVSYLVTGNADQSITAYRPGSVVCLEQDGDQAWQIQWMIRPDLFR